MLMKTFKGFFTIYFLVSTYLACSFADFTMASEANK